MKIDLVWHEAGNELYYDRFAALAKKSELSVHGFKQFMGVQFESPKSEGQAYNLMLHTPIFPFHWLTVFSFSLITSLIRSKSDAIYIHEEPHSLLALLICLFCYKKRIYLDCAVINEKGSFNKKNLFERFVYLRASGIFYRNDQVRQILLKRGAPSNKLLCMLGNGVSARTFKVRPNKQRTAKTIKIGYAGRVWRSKGVDCLLAIQGLERVQVVYCGNVIDHELHEKIQASGADYKGMLGIDGLTNFYSDIDLFILPSIPTSNWSEQFGRVIIESVFSGTPSIGSDTGFIPRLVGESATFEAGNIDQILERVNYFMDDKLRQELWEQQYAKISRDFSWEAIAEKVINRVDDE